MGPELSAAYQRYHDLDLEMLAINPDHFIQWADFDSFLNAFNSSNLLGTISSKMAYLGLNGVELANCFIQTIGN